MIQRYAETETIQKLWALSFLLEIPETFRVKWKGFFLFSRSKIAIALVDKKKKKHSRDGARRQHLHFKDFKRLNRKVWKNGKRLRIQLLSVGNRMKAGSENGTI